ncbi:uncharacterized protein LOC127715396 [Mytilus californianus]|uniref:uncharacterized protein LOC127715396 n=1 Tax=Mytilus californianus TaxID=6549 RepID=UPI002247FD54|nr:uncharacterized protein LOC127715396 [Mytilus californianus]
MHMSKYFFLIFGIHYIHTIANIGKDGYCKKENVTFKTTNGTDTSQKKFCCTHYEKQNNKCKECKVGYTSRKGKPCHPCEAGMYGKKCVHTCKCEGSQRCHHVTGCIAKDKTSKAGRQKEDQKPKDVVIYMSCVAVFGLLLAAAFSVWKYRQTLLRVISTWKNRQPSFGELRTGKQFNFKPDENDRSSKSGLENIYSVINEKEMLQICEIE